MKTFLDCIPCIIRQALEAAKQISTDSAVHEQIIREVLCWISEMDMTKPAPAIGQRIHRRLRSMTGQEDPYRKVKDFHNRIVLALLPDLKTAITAAPDPLNMALRLAIAGNSIDMGVNGHITESAIHEAVFHALAAPFVGDMDEFRTAVSEARHILYLTDNAGEIVLDRLLIEQIGPARVTAAVRGAPAINDATRADALAVGLQEIVEVIDNGSDAPGTILDDCSPEFTRRFSEADLILAKGQGNFETLSDVPKNIYFLFKAKCFVVAEHAHVPLGTHVLIRSRAGLAAGGGL
ncbi:DUF89 family protein [candidate division KSB1 bacterium]|nr:MAG: DUF89 family protein [candidate division KSB1 bacterium]